MLDIREVVFLLCTAVVVRAQTSAPPSERILEPWGGPASFTGLYIQSIDAFFGAERAYRDRDYFRASEILKKFWSDHPPGTREWVTEQNDEGKLVLSKGPNFGRPVGYYALRMLTECVNWKLRPATGTRSNPVRLTVILVGQSSGVAPRTFDELKNKAGVSVHHTLDPLLAADGSAREILDQSLYLFGDYIGAITEGGLGLEVKVLRLPNLNVPVDAVSITQDVAGTQRTIRIAGLSSDGLNKIWGSVDARALAATDWWFVLYPSHVPEQYPDFAHTDFVTGGMGKGFDGRSPTFIIDDRCWSACHRIWGTAS